MNTLAIMFGNYYFLFGNYYFLKFCNQDISRFIHVVTLRILITGLLCLF